MHPNVRPHAAHRVAPIPADRAAERLHAGVRVQVAFRVAGARAHHIAQRTLILVVVIRGAVRMGVLVARF